MIKTKYAATKILYEYYAKKHSVPFDEAVGLTCGFYMVEKTEHLEAYDESVGFYDGPLIKYLGVPDDLENELLSEYNERMLVLSTYFTDANGCEVQSHEKVNLAQVARLAEELYSTPKELLNAIDKHSFTDNKTNTTIGIAPTRNERASKKSELNERSRNALLKVIAALSIALKNSPKNLPSANAMGNFLEKEVKYIEHDGTRSLTGAKKSTFKALITEIEQNFEIKIFNR